MVCSQQTKFKCKKDLLRSVFGIKLTDLQNMELKINGLCIRLVESCKYPGITIERDLN